MRVDPWPALVREVASCQPDRHHDAGKHVDHRDDRQDEEGRGPGFADDNELDVELYGLAVELFGRRNG